MDDEVRSAIEAVKRRIIEERLRCCLDDVEPGYVAASGEELRAYINTCRVVAVFFYSPTCPYCKIYAPIFVDVGQEFRGLAAFIAVDVSRMPWTAEGLGVRGTPTTIVFIRGRPALFIPGVISYEDLKGIISSALRKAGCDINVKPVMGAG